MGCCANLKSKGFLFWMDIIILGASLAAIVGGAFLFSDGIEKSQNVLMNRENCDALFRPKENTNSDSISFEKLQDMKNVAGHLKACEDATGSLDTMVVLTWLFSFALLISGIVGLVFIGHRLTHELKHSDSETG